MRRICYIGRLNEDTEAADDTIMANVALRVTSGAALELIAVAVPFGFTLLVEPYCIHGDSSLTGLYMMAMTGNHRAMGTADTHTVFIKQEKCGNSS